MNHSDAYLTNVIVHICSLRRDASIDNPSYRVPTRYSISLRRADFETLGTLKDAIRVKTKAGFLRSQFFRVQLNVDAETLEHNGRFCATSHFIETTEDLHTALSTSDLPTQLLVVRYTKAQSAQLQGKISHEEYPHLKELLEKKRKYVRKIEFIDGERRIVRSISNLPGGETLLDSSTDPDLVTTLTYLDSDGPELDRYYETDGTPDDIARQLRDTPLGRLYPEAALNFWASHIIAQTATFNSPPPEFPIPDSATIAGYRRVAVRHDLQGICLLYSAYLGRTHPMTEEESAPPVSQSNVLYLEAEEETEEESDN